MLYTVLKTMSWIASHTPYKLLVKIGKGLGYILWRVLKKQRVRAEKTVYEGLGYSHTQSKEVIRKMFVNMGISILEMLYMPALNKDNIGSLVTFDHPEILWEALQQKKGVVLLACHFDNWEWLGAALALNGFPLSAVEKPQPNRVYSDFMNELRRGAGQEIFARGSSEILGFVPFLGKMASTPAGPAYFARKFKAPCIPIYIVRNPGGCGHQVIVEKPFYYENTGNQEADDYNLTLKMTRSVEQIIKKYPENWLWFQHRWNTPYEEVMAKEQDSREK